MQARIISPDDDNVVLVSAEDGATVAVVIGNAVFSSGGVPLDELPCSADVLRLAAEVRIKKRTEPLLLLATRYLGIIRNSDYCSPLPDPVVSSDGSKVTILVPSSYLRERNPDVEVRFRYIRDSR